MAGIFGDLPTNSPPSYLENLQASAGEWTGATASDNWKSSPVALLKRDWEYRNALPSGTTDFFAPAEKILDQATAFDRAKEAGVKIDVPENGISESAFNILMKRRQDEAARRSALMRSPSGLGPTAVKIGIGLAVSMLDPLNIASAFIPVVGPARYASMLARAGSTAGRAAVRLRVGAVEGAVGAALLEPLVYGLSKDLQDDYTLRDSLVNIAFGTVLGGGLHAGAGLVGDMVSKRYGRTSMPAIMEQVQPEVRQAALRTSVAQMVEGKPVDIQPLMRLPDTMERLSEVSLGEFRTDAIKRRALNAQGIARIDASIGKIEADRVAALDRAKEIDPLKAEVESLRSDIERVQTERNNVTPAFDDASKARVQAIEADLAGKPLSNKDRARLEKERDLILQSVKDGMTDADARRRVASYEQELKGLSKALNNKQRALSTAEKRFQSDVAKTDRAARDAELRRRQLNDRLSSQEDTILSETRKSIMNLAREGYMISLQRADAENLARSLLRASDDEAQGVLRNITDTLKNMSLRENGPLINRELMASVQRQATELSQLADERASIDASRKLKDDPSGTDEIQTANDNLDADTRELRDLAARIGDDEIVARELAQFDELQKTADGYGDFVRAMASCQLRRGA